MIPKLEIYLNWLRFFLRQVSKQLGRHLTPPDMADFQHFLSMKAKLLTDTREIDDKICLGEEQVAALSASSLEDHS